MRKLKIFFLISLVVLGGMVILAFLPPIMTGKGYSEVTRDHIIQQVDGYLLQFDIINNEGQDETYIIKISIDDYNYTENVTILNGRIFTYGHHIYLEKMVSGIVSLVILKEGQSNPLAEINYHLK
jgi:hypothetical protein